MWIKETGRLLVLDIRHAYLDWYPKTYREALHLFENLAEKRVLTKDYGTGSNTRMEKLDCVYLKGRLKQSNSAAQSRVSSDASKSMKDGQLMLAKFDMESKSLIKMLADRVYAEEKHKIPDKFKQMLKVSCRTDSEQRYVIVAVI